MRRAIGSLLLLALALLAVTQPVASLRLRATEALRVRRASRTLSLARVRARMAAGAPADELVSLLDMLKAHLDSEQEAADEAAAKATQACSDETDAISGRISSAQDSIQQLKAAVAAARASIVSKTEETETWRTRASRAAAERDRLAAKLSKERSSWEDSAASYDATLAEHQQVLGVVREVKTALQDSPLAKRLDAGGDDDSDDSSEGDALLQLSAAARAGRSQLRALVARLSAATAVTGESDALARSGVARVFRLLDELAGELETAHGEEAARKEKASALAAATHSALEEQVREQSSLKSGAETSIATLADEMADLQAGIRRDLDASAAAGELVTKDSAALDSARGKCAAAREEEKEETTSRQQELSVIAALREQVTGRLAGQLSLGDSVSSATDAVSTTFRWVPADWTACSATCGEGTQTRAIKCVNFAGNTVEGEACEHSKSAGPAPAASRACDAGKCRWSTEEWGDCSAACGDGKRSRVVRCLAANGDAYVPPSADGGQQGCPGAGAAPAREQACSAGSCSWDATAWTPCSRPCGGGQQSRTVTCKTPSGDMWDAEGCPDAGEKPASVASCNVDACVWKATPWTPCSGACGAGTQSRAVSCQTTAGAAVEGDCFAAGEQPVDRRACERACSWKVADWGKCSKPCGGGDRQRAVACVTPEGQPFSPDGDNSGAQDGDCPLAGDKPAQRGACNEADCAWKATPWASCSADCGGGSQSRSASCVDADGDAVAAELCKTADAPELTQQCNTQECPPNQLSLVAEGGQPSKEAENLATTDAGASLFGMSTDLPGHALSAILDDAASSFWIAPAGKPTLTVRFGARRSVRRIAWARDNRGSDDGALTDRVRGKYTWLMTRVPSPDGDTPDSAFKPLAEVVYPGAEGVNDDSMHLRHEFLLDRVEKEVTGLRLHVAPGTALSSLEVYDE
eukprot:PLAT12539.46.p1 GENE.PLAT12539.46~~PLAT12539.46.p1  ORF type:complete len:926 (+),score=513.52 PLAT12539.46:1530-4307(+)